MCSFMNNFAIKIGVLYLFVRKHVSSVLTDVILDKQLLCNFEYRDSEGEHVTLTSLDGEVYFALNTVSFSHFPSLFLFVFFLFLKS